MKRILILGGYGGFGARLSRRLVADGHKVIVAGRSLASAQQFCAGVPQCEPLEADRNQDLAPLLASLKPDLLVDAAGPFQNSSYHVVEACLAQRIPYIDLADAVEFVSGIGDLDLLAERAGVAVISGASSVPALSGAVIRKLAHGLDRVASIEMAISASNRATAGPSVASAILSYVGKPVRLWRGKRWIEAFGWQELKWQNFTVSGRTPIRRLVALADIPDHQIVPKSVVGVPAMIFRAGPEFAFQTLSLWALSWLVRWGVLRSLNPVAGWLRRLQGLTAAFGSDRSAMVVTLKGACGDDLVQRRWTLIAENGDGPDIPTLAAQLIAGEILSGRVAAGARDAGNALSLEQFEPLFSDLSVHHEITEAAYVPVYQRVMGSAFDQLPIAVRRLHQLIGDGGVYGSATVTRGTNLCARLVGWIMGFPPAGKHDLQVSFSERAGIERWTRDFSGRRFSSHLSEKGGKLTERFGPLHFSFDLPSSVHGLEMIMRRWAFMGIPLPLALAPKSVAREWQEGDDFCFDVPISLPLIGRVVHYQGRLRMVTQSPATVAPPHPATCG